eukprot:3885534-Prymnesium_polylepis.1
MPDVACAHGPMGDGRWWRPACLCINERLRLYVARRSDSLVGGLVQACTWGFVWSLPVWRLADRLLVA